MAWAQKRDGKFRAMYRDADGKVRSAGTYTHERMALKKAGAAEEESRKYGFRNPDRAKESWGSWSERWWPTRPVVKSTLKRDLSRLEVHLIPYWSNTPLGEITRQGIREWAADLRRTKDEGGAGLSETSVERCVALLSASLSAAVDDEILTHNPAYRLGLPKGEKDERHYLTHRQAISVAAKVDKESTDRAIIVTLFALGLRWGELAGLQIPRVNLKTRRVRVIEAWDDKNGELVRWTKGKKIRELPLPAWAVPYLERAMGGRSAGFVFTSAEGKPLDYSNWRRRVWMKATRRAGIEATIHDTRHTYASWLVQAGFSLEVIAKLLGHESTQVTQIYAHLGDLNLDAIANVLETGEMRPVADGSKMVATDPKSSDAEAYILDTLEGRRSPESRASGALDMAS